MNVKVVVLDDRSNSNPSVLAEFANHPSVEIVVGSTLRSRDVDSAIRGCTEVYHLAATVGVRRVAGRAASVYAANVRGAACVTGACKRWGVPLLFVSSSEVYGSADAAVAGCNKKFAESDAPGFDASSAASDGRAAYALSKWEGERMALEAASAGVPAVVVRPFNMIGAGQSVRSGALVPSLLHHAFEDGVLPLEGDGSSTRAWLPVVDAARAMVELLHCGRARGRVVNLGGTRVLSILEIAELVRARIASPCTIRLQQKTAPAGIVTIRDRRPDLTFLEHCLGTLPRTPLEKALSDAIEFAAAQTRKTCAAISR
jgi:UDP-glucose 4-epimerase